MAQELEIMQRKAEWLESTAKEGRAGVEARDVQKDAEIAHWKALLEESEHAKEEADGLWRAKVK